MPFTIEELTFWDMYKAKTIEQTKEEISRILPLIEDDEMQNLAKCVLTKLNKISSDQLNQLDFKNALTPDNTDTTEP